MKKEESNSVKNSFESSFEKCKLTLKDKFIESDYIQLKNYVSDLKKSLEINKIIVSELIRTQIEDQNYKKVIEALNKDNIGLRMQLEKTTKELNQAQSKLLICEQIVNNQRKYEQELLIDVKFSKMELIDKLNRNE